MGQHLQCCNSGSGTAKLRPDGPPTCTSVIRALPAMPPAIAACWEPLKRCCKAAFSPWGRWEHLQLGAVTMGRPPTRGGTQRQLTVNIMDGMALCKAVTASTVELYSNAGRLPVLQQVHPHFSKEG